MCKKKIYSIFILPLVVAVGVKGTGVKISTQHVTLPDGIGPDGTRYKTAYKCEGEDLEISCSTDQTIKIIRANFGRFSIAICNKHGTTDMSVNCMSPASNRVMKKKCDGQSSCSITITANEFGDPCPNTPKYLEVHYGCVPKSTTTTKKPLPAWFLQGGSDQLWETRIPDPPEGFEPEKSSSESGKLTPEATTVPETRIPITTPTGTTMTTTIVTTTATTKKPQTTGRPEATYQPQPSILSSDAAEMEYQQMLKQESTENYTPQISIEIVDIPVEDQPYHCPPTTARNLAWNWTKSGETAIQPCPPGTTGLARWVCGLPEDVNDTPVFWSSRQPDMSDCRSLSMTRLEGKVEAGDLENVLSASLAHHSKAEIMYGGDIESAAAIMKTLSNRIQYLLQTQGDKFYNKAQYIQEVLLNMVRSGSNMLDVVNKQAWDDLHPSRQVKAAAAMMQVLEENAFLFVEVTKQEEVLVESSQNILMSASIMEIGRLTNGTKLPVTDYEEPYGSLDNSVIIPFNVLWEEARNGITKLVHFSFRNVHEILGQAEVDLSNQASSNSLLGVSRSSMSINSRVISASLGRGRAGQQIQFPHTIQVNLQHLTPVSADSAVVCAAWDYQVSAWTNSGCTLISTNKTNSVCRCNRMSAYTVMLTPHHNDPAHIGSPSVPIMTLQIVTYIVAAISVLCVVLILIKFRHNIQKILYKTPCLNQEEKHACNPRTRSCLNMGLSAEKNTNHTIQSNMMQRAINSCTLDPKQESPGPEMVVQGQEGSMTLMQPNLYRTQFENGTPVMVTLNPYSSQLVDNLNKMMGDPNMCYDAAMNPQLARLTATLKKKQGNNVNIHENTTMQLMERVGGCMYQDGVNQPPQARMVNPSDVVFRAVSPHGHVYWEINPKQQPGQLAAAAGQHKSQHQHSSSDDNTNSDLQNISDFSDDDNRAASEMSRQSSSRFSESRPLIYSGSSTSTSPGHSVNTDPRHGGSHHHDNITLPTTSGSVRQNKFSPRPGPVTRSPWVSSPAAGQSPAYHDEVYAYAATDFSSGSYIPETVQSQVQIRDCRAVPVSIKSKEYIMAKIADYTERQSNQV